jgi:hypothetical protein
VPRRFFINWHLSFADVRSSCYFRRVLELTWREFYEARRPWFSRPFRLDRSRRDSLEEGSPLVLLRERPHLVKTFTYEFRQPYHTAEKRSPAEARGFISSVRAEARGLAYRVIHSVQRNLQEQGYELKCCSLLLASGKPLPSLPQILASHALIHAADGELFREALLHASKRCGSETFTAKESELLERAVHALHLQPNELGRRLTDLGHPLGSPWSRDEKFAALVAWLSLL